MQNIDIESIESAIAAMLPEVAAPPELSLEEEFTLFRDRKKQFRVEVGDGGVQIHVTYEGICRFLSRKLLRLAVDNEKFSKTWYGLNEIFVCFGTRPKTHIFFNFDNV